MGDRVVVLKLIAALKKLVAKEALFKQIPMIGMLLVLMNSQGVFSGKLLIAVVNVTYEHLDWSPSTNSKVKSLS